MGGGRTYCERVVAEAMLPGCAPPTRNGMPPHCRCNHQSSSLIVVHLCFFLDIHNPDLGTGTARGAAAVRDWWGTVARRGAQQLFSSSLSLTPRLLALAALPAALAEEIEVARFRGHYSRECRCRAAEQAVPTL